MVLAQLAVFGAISMLIVFYTVFDLLRFRPFDGPFTVTVQLGAAGGIFDGAEVAYRGVEVGRVSGVDLRTDGVTVRLALDSGTEVPDNSTAHVYDLSAVGEQYVDLEPPARPSPHVLREGSVIPVERTTTPLETAKVIFDLERFVDSVNPDDLGVIAREGAAAFAGTGPQLKSILADATSIVQQLTSSQANQVDLLQNASLLLQTAARHRGDFDQFASSLKALTGTLAASTPAIEKFLADAAPTTQLINQVIADNGSAISVLLGNLATLSNIQVTRLPGLRSLLVAVPEFGRLAPTLVRNGALSVAASLNIGQPVCPSGVPLTSPISGVRSPLYSANCTSGLLARGAVNAPRPGGAGAVASARRLADGTQVGAYDPLTGYVSTSDGQRLRLGSTGGQELILGPNSWQALLMPPSAG